MTTAAERLMEATGPGGRRLDDVIEVCGEVARLLTENTLLRSQIEELRGALIEADAALDNYADASAEGDPAEYQPNRAMQAQTEVRRALGWIR